VTRRTWVAPRPLPAPFTTLFKYFHFLLLKVLRGKFRQVNWFVYALTALLVLRFVYPVRG